MTMPSQSTHRNMANWDRAISVGVGAGLVLHALSHRRWRTTAGVAGALMVARGAAGYCPAYGATGVSSIRDDRPEHVLSGPGGRVLRAAVTIARDPRDVFAFWTAFENLPTFIRRLVRVERLADRRTRWTMRGPGGAPIVWEADIINEIEPEVLAWRSAPGWDVVSAGSVRFAPARNGGTEVRVAMQYENPGGSLGRAVGWLTNFVPAIELREDLRRLKQRLETGEVPATGHQPSGPRSAPFRFLSWATT